MTINCYKITTTYQKKLVYSRGGGRLKNKKKFNFRLYALQLVFTTRWSFIAFNGGFNLYANSYLVTMAR